MTLTPAMRAAARELFAARRMMSASGRVVAHDVFNDRCPVNQAFAREHGRSQLPTDLLCTCGEMEHMTEANVSEVEVGGPRCPDPADTPRPRCCFCPKLSVWYEIIVDGPPMTSANPVEGVTQTVARQLPLCDAHARRRVQLQPSIGGINLDSKMTAPFYRWRPTREPGPEKPPAPPPPPSEF